NARLPSRVGDAASEINGMSIFWIIVPLFLACMIHPIGSACGFRPAYRHQVRIGPLMSLFDISQLLYEIHSYYGSAPGGDSIIRRIRRTIREVVVVRLYRHLRSEQDDHSNLEGASLTAALLCRFEKAVYSAWIRDIFSIMLILQYVGRCGFYGIPVSFSLVTVYFISWIIMEMILLVGKGCAAVDPRGVDPPTAHSSSPIISKFAGIVFKLFLLQVITFYTGTMIFLWREIFRGTMFGHSGGLSFPSIRCAAHLSGLFLPQHWIGHMFAFYFVIHGTVERVVWMMSWVLGLSASNANYLMFFYASRLPWPGGTGEEGLRWEEGPPRQGFVFHSSAFIYAGELVLCYIFLFDREGTRKA
ncbi:unnamed protein product, partial [Tuber aestivum]